LRSHEDVPTRANAKVEEIGKTSPPRLSKKPKGTGRGNCGTKFNQCGRKENLRVKWTKQKKKIPKTNNEKKNENTN